MASPMDVLMDAVSYQQQQQQHQQHHHHQQSLPSHPVPRDVPAPTPQPGTGFSASSQHQHQPQPQPHTSQGGPPHRCHLCARTYERADHLNRHLKSHENARPYKCSRCAKSFNRADLLNRHESSHDRQAEGGGKPRIERGERVAAACKACVISKSKCQDQKPCARCVKKGVACEDSAAAGLRESRPLDSSSPRRQSVIADGSRPPASVSGSSMAESQRGFGSPSSSKHSDNFSSSAIGYQEHPTNPNQNYSTGYYPGPAAASVNVFLDPSFQNDSYMSMDPQFSLGFMPRDQYFGQDFDFGALDIDLHNFEMAYQFKGSQVESSSPSTTGHVPSNRQKNASKRIAAFERSPWMWSPTDKDRTLSDHGDLNLDEERIPGALAGGSPTATMDDFSFCCLDAKIRDQLLAILVSVRQSRIQVPSFPSLALLNNLVETYFVQNNLRLDHLIHAATFEPQKALTHLLVAILCEGSSYISTPAIWKFGLALQEIVRHTVGDLWEADNSTTRNLETLQAYITGLDVGIWSGDSRKMQLAQAFGPVIGVMLRSSGVFSALRNPSVVTPEENDSDQVLEMKWRKWAERESWKRVALRLFKHNVHTSIMFYQPPWISFNELKFALPASRELWLAKSASDWRDRYLSISASEISNYSLADALQCSDILFQSSTHIDMMFTGRSMLYGFWGQIWNLLEAKKFYPASKITHRLAISTTHTELYCDILSLSNLIPPLTRHSAEINLLAEMFMMTLHASPEDLQRFGGASGEEEAKKANTEFLEWSKILDSRVAVWHAGQVLRAADQLGQAQCRRFNAIAVYYAALTLWVYGLVATPSSPYPPNSGQRFSQTPVVVNGAEDASVQNWRASGEGIPSLRLMRPDGRGEILVPLEDTDRILQAARDIYKNNFPPGEGETEGSVPLLVENMGRLLKELGDMAGSKESTTNSEDDA